MNESAKRTLKWLGPLVLVLMLLSLTVSPSLDAPGTTFTANAIAYRVHRSDDDVVFESSGLLYRVRSDDAALVTALRESNRAGAPMNMRVHLDGAYFRMDGDPVFWVESLNIAGKSYGPFEPRKHVTIRLMSGANANLLRGLAFERGRRYREAIDALDAALRSDDLGKTRAALALDTRARAFSTLAYDGRTRDLNSKDDRLLMSAVGDLYNAGVLDPNNWEYPYQAAYALRALGGYDEARALYDDVERRFPDQRIPLAIARASLARLLGRNEESLRMLDELAVKENVRDRMTFHYQRALTLIELDRDEEAVAELTRGLANRPEFPWAFVSRACAHGSLGQLDAAVDDLRRALALWSASTLEPRHPSYEPVRDGMETMLRELETAQSEAPGAPSAAACGDVVYDPSESPRPRSSQLSINKRAG